MCVVCVCVVCVGVCVVCVCVLRSWLDSVIGWRSFKSSVDLNSLVTTYVVYGLCLPACLLV